MSARQRATGADNRSFGAAAGTWQPPGSVPHPVALGESRDEDLLLAGKIAALLGGTLELVHVVRGVDDSALVVMPRFEPGFTHSTVVGSVTEWLAGHVPCPVLVVGQGAPKRCKSAVEVQATVVDWMGEADGLA